jgi:putative ABC transport system permease protein
MLFQDIRFGVRTALKNKGVTALAVVCLGIGIGLNTMMFSVTDGVLIQPLPYKDPDRIVALNTTNKQQGIRRGNFSLLDVQDWRERTRSFSAIAALQYRNFTVSDGGDADRYLGAAISHELFSLLGMPPQLGRDFRADDDRHGAEPVVLLSDDLWRRRYNADPSIVGRAIQVNSRPHTVIGVMPPKFKFPENQYLWLPLEEFVYAPSPRGNRGLATFARLKDGVSLDQARTDADAVAAGLAEAFPDTNKGWGASLRTMRDWAIPSDVSLIIWTMMSSVTMVLLIACFNVANLMLARASTRAREMSIRTALGAGRGQILRQLLTESVIVGLLSVPLGILCAMGGLKLMDMSIPPDDIPYFIQWSLNVRALLYAIGVAGLTGIAFGIVPALQASKPDLQEGLKEGARGMAGGGRAWIRNVLIVAEVALSLLLLIGASLYTRSFVQLKQANGGFDARPLMTLRYYMPNEIYTTPELKTQRTEDVVRRVEALPGVLAAFASNMVPLDGGGDYRNIEIDGHPSEKGREPGAEFMGVTPHMLKTLGLTIRRGRELTETESFAKTPYAVVNDAMVKKFWPNEDPLGRRFKIVNGNEGWFTVVGVVPDYRHGQLDNNDPIEPCAYVSFAYGAFANTGLTVRAAGDPASLTAPLREALRASDPKMALFNVRTMEEVRALGYWQYFLFGWMFSLFGAIALALAAIGVYGVLSYAVAQRTQEIGVRVALGASRMDVLKLVVVQGLRLAVIGVVIGVIGSFFVTPVIQSTLINVSATDPASFIGVSIFLTAVAFVASYVPARRATAVDPLVALRAE